MWCPSPCERYPPWQSWIWWTSQTWTEARCARTASAPRTHSPCQSPSCATCRSKTCPPLLCSSSLCLFHTEYAADEKVLCTLQSEHKKIRSNKRMMLHQGIVTWYWVSLLDAVLPMLHEKTELSSPITPSLKEFFEKVSYRKQKTWNNYFGIKGFLDTDPPLNSCLSSFNLSHNPLNVLQFIATLPENS